MVFRVIIITVPLIIPPYTPEQNGMIARFFRTIKEKCIWHYNFKSIKEANETITRWIEFYNWNDPYFIDTKLVANTSSFSMSE